MTNRSSSSELKPWWSSTFDTVGVKVIAENVDLQQLSQQYPKRITYRPGRYEVKGRFGTTARLRSHRGRGVLFIEASIPKFLTGQNLIGTENLLQATIELIDDILSRAHIELLPHEVRRYRSGNFWLTRVDYANHCWCGSHEQSLIVMDALHRRIAATNCDFSQYRQQTLYLRRKSKRSTIKAYLKWLELQTHRHQMGALVRHRDILLEKAKGLVRFELTLRGQELKRLDLARPNAWTPEIARALLNRQVAGMLPLAGEVINLKGMKKLRLATRMRLELFLRGQIDVFKRYKRARLDDRRDIRRHTGIDIDSKLTPSEQQKNMQPLQEVFEQGWGFYSWEKRKWENMKKGKSGLM